MIQLGADDDAIANAFNPSHTRGMRTLRIAISRPILNLAEPGVAEYLRKKYG